MQPKRVIVPFMAFVTWRRVVAILMLAASVSFGQTTALTALSRNTAAIIGVAPDLNALERLRTEPPGTEATLRRLVLRQKITEDVVAASLDIDMAIAEIQREQTQIRAASDVLASRRDRAVNMVTIGAAVAGGGIGVVGTAMQFSDRTAYAGDGVSVGAGVASLALSLVGIRVQRGGRGQIGVAPNMLAMVFGRPHTELSVYPDEIWTYLNSRPEMGTHTQTRLQLLIEQWRNQGMLGPANSPRTAQKIGFLTSSFAEHRRLRLSDLSDRAAMLGDVRSSIALMNRDLAELMRYLRNSGF